MAKWRAASSYNSTRWRNFGAIFAGHSENTISKCVTEFQMSSMLVTKVCSTGFFSSIALLCFIPWRHWWLRNPYTIVISINLTPNDLQNSSLNLNLGYIPRWVVLPQTRGNVHCERVRPCRSPNLSFMAKIEKFEVHIPMRVHISPIGMQIIFFLASETPFRLAEQITEVWNYIKILAERIAADGITTEILKMLANGFDPTCSHKKLPPTCLWGDKQSKLRQVAVVQLKCCLFSLMLFLFL